MKKPTIIILVLLLLAAACSAVWLLLAPGQTDRPTAKITLDGELLEEIDLTQVTEAYTFTVEGTSGLTNIIQVEPGRIRVKSADCPDQVCVHQGFIFDGAVPIVCLPNKLIIQITGGGDGLDTATG